MTMELKSCPFCGSIATRKTHKKYRGGYMATVGCTRCGAMIERATKHNDYELAYQYAENAWNERLEVITDGAESA